MTCKCQSKKAFLVNFLTTAVVPILSRYVALDLTTFYLRRKSVELYMQCSKKDPYSVGLAGLLADLAVVGRGHRCRRDLANTAK